MESDLLLLKPIKMARNPSDLLTKLLGKILFHRHVDVLMGRIIPDWVPLQGHDRQVSYAPPGLGTQ